MPDCHIPAHSRNPAGSRHPSRTAAVAALWEAARLGADHLHRAKTRDGEAEADMFHPHPKEMVRGWDRSGRTLFYSPPALAAAPDTSMLDRAPLQYIQRNDACGVNPGGWRVHVSIQQMPYTLGVERLVWRGRPHPLVPAPLARSLGQHRRGSGMPGYHIAIRRRARKAKLGDGSYALGIESTPYRSLSSRMRRTESSIRCLVIVPFVTASWITRSASAVDSIE